MRTQSTQYEINLEYNVNSHIRLADLELIEQHNNRTKEQRDIDEFYSKQDYGGVKND